MQVRVCENCYITITDHEKTPRANFFDTRYKHIIMFPQRLWLFCSQAHCEAHELWCWKAASRHCWARSCHQGIRESSFPKATPNTPTTADLEHEDRVGGLLDGGSLAEGHREEPGGGEGGGSQGQPGGSPYPHPWLLSQGCRPLQGQLSQVLIFCLSFAINPCIFRWSFDFQPSGPSARQKLWSFSLPDVFAGQYFGKPETHQILPSESR